MTIALPYFFSVWDGMEAGSLFIPQSRFHRIVAIGFHLWRICNDCRYDISIWSEIQ
jgi:hypothetical protein